MEEEGHLKAPSAHFDAKDKLSVRKSSAAVSNRKTGNAETPLCSPVNEASLSGKHNPRYLVTDENVDARGALSVNLVDLVQRDIERQSELACDFSGCHFFQVDCMIHCGKKSRLHQCVLTDNE